MKTLPTLLLTLLVLGGCASSYSYKDGVENNIIPVYGYDNKFLVKYSTYIRGLSDEEELDYLLLRSSEFALEKGFNYFHANDLYRAEGSSFNDDYVQIDILLLDKESAEGETYNAQYVLSSLRKKYQINEAKFASSEEKEKFDSYLENINASKKRIERKRNKEAFERKKERERIALEKRKQQEFNRLYNTCLGFGFTEQNAIASCIQQEIFNEKKLLALKEQQIALEKQIALNSAQVESQEDESGFFLTVLEGVAESLADPQTWEIARNKAEIEKLKRNK